MRIHKITEVYRSKLSLRPSKEWQAKLTSFETCVFNIISLACQNVSHHILRLSVGLEDVVTFRPLVAFFKSWLQEPFFATKHDEVQLMT